MFDHETLFDWQNCVTTTNKYTFRWSQKKQYGREIRAVKHFFLLIVENMLKNFETVRSDCITKEEIIESH